jgi:hypothetical protein
MASLLILGCISQANNNNNGTITVSEPKEKITAKFFVKGNNGLVGKTIEVEKGANALEEMKKLFDLNYSMSQYGAFITGINGEQAPSDSYWAMYIDGNYAMVGISSLAIDKNMEISWKLEKIQTT